MLRECSINFCHASLVVLFFFPKKFRMKYNQNYTIKAPKLLNERNNYFISSFEVSRLEVHHVCRYNLKYIQVTFWINYFFSIDVSLSARKLSTHSYCYWSCWKFAVFVLSLLKNFVFIFQFYKEKWVYITLEKETETYRDREKECADIWSVN